ncbi:MAG: GTP-binding protein [Clostridia bacterium]|nr:GTP-binding protein [Clostridia bacterium]
MYDNNMKILIVSGFLGAGKTTFIKALIKHTNENIVVMENEMGDTTLDSQAISSAGGAEVYDFMEGCVCCNMKDSFATSLLAVENTLSPDYVVVEPTGAAMLGNIIENVRKICYERISLLPSLAIVTPHSFAANMTEFGGVLRDQISNAETIVFSKLDRADAAETADVADKIRRMNRSAKIISEPYGTLSDEWWHSLLSDEKRDENRGFTAGRHSEFDELEELSYRRIYFRSEADLIIFANDALFGRLGDVVRIKGVVRAGTEWMSVNLADSVYEISGAPEGVDVSQCVIIGKKLDKSSVERHFVVIPELKPRTGYGLKDF